MNATITLVPVNAGRVISHMEVTTPTDYIRRGNMPGRKNGPAAMRARMRADEEAVAALPIGGEREVFWGFHPRHGTEFRVMRRTA